MLNRRLLLIVLPIAALAAVAFALTAKTSLAPTVNLSNASAEPANVSIAAQKPPPEATLLAVGDVMLSRIVGQKMVKNGYDYPFTKTADVLRSADITFANLETSITPGRVIQTGEMSFRADPESAKALADAGFDVLSLANNHTPNFGAKGLTDTFRFLTEAGIAYAGAGADDTEAHRPAILERNGLKLAFLAYNDTDVAPDSYEAAPNHAGTAFMNIERMKEDVAAAKAKADLVIVSMHSGIEYKPVPNRSQIDFAHAGIDAGADLIIGHHPHVVQTSERYHDKYIFYSLGNFIFDQMWSQQTREGLAVKFQLNAAGVQNIQYLPVVIDDYSQPHFVTGEKASSIIGRLGSISEAGTIATPQ